MLLARANLVTCIDIKERDILKHLTLCGEGSLHNVVKGYTLIQQESQISAHLRILRQFGVFYAILLYNLKQLLPIYLCNKDRLLYAKLSCPCRRDRTHHRKILAVKLIDKPLCKEVRRSLSILKRVNVGTKFLEKEFQVSLKQEEISLLYLVAPLLGAVTCNYHREARLLLVAFEFRILLWSKHSALSVLAFAIKRIDIAKLKEFKISILPVDVISNHLQRAEEKCLTHSVKVRTQRINHHNASLLRIRVKTCIIICLCKGVVHNLHKAVCRKELRCKHLYPLRVRLRRGIN